MELKNNKENDVNKSLISVPIEKLKVGMYLEEMVNVGYLEHDFVTSSFLITSDDEIKKIRATGVKTVIVCKDKSRLIQSPDKLKETIQAKATGIIGDGSKEAIIKVTPNDPELLKKDESDKFKRRLRDHKKVPFDDEMKNAKIVNQSVRVFIKDLMKNIKEGKKIDMVRVTKAVQMINNSILNNPYALLSLGSIRKMDEYTFIHSLCTHVYLLGKFNFLIKNNFDVGEVTKETLIDIGIGGLLHDIGKTKTPITILNKPGELTYEEFIIMKNHVIEGIKILENTEGISPTSIMVAKMHHEKYDGSGYPDGLKGDEIHLYGKLAALSDVYDALTSERVYKPGMSPFHAINKMNEWNKKSPHFDPELLRYFINFVGMIPTSTVVLLDNGLIGIVREPGESDPLKPTVKVFFDIKSRQHLMPRNISLEDNNNNFKIVKALALKELETTYGIKQDIIEMHIG